MSLEIANRLLQVLNLHEEWRTRSLNLIPSENITSPQVRRMLASDFGHRYAWDEPWYGGQKYTEEVERLAVEAAKDLFRAKYANVRPLSGHLSLMAVVLGLCEPGDSVLISSFENGGYPLSLQARFPLDLHYFPYREDRYTMNVEAAIELLEQVQPKLAILGASLFPFPHPVKELAEAAHSVGSTLAYDGSHVLGLIAGEQFQDPFKEGADILLGSTHKTFPGPQGGILLVREDMELAEKIDLTLRPPPVLVDNYHHHRVAALAMTLGEMLQFGKAYAKQVVENAQTLARNLHEGGIRILGASQGYTRSHQILLEIEGAEHGHQIRDHLEEADIIADSGVRLGTQEVARRGMCEEEMIKIAELISKLLVEQVPSGQVKRQVHELTQQFQEVHYRFNIEI
ncbi:MAG: serine hydroxymethyltransferase [Promethearchaeota archaeon]